MNIMQNKHLKLIPRSNTIQLLKVNTKQEILKAVGEENTHYIGSNKDKNDSRLLMINNANNKLMKQYH